MHLFIWQVPSLLSTFLIGSFETGSKENELTFENFKEKLDEKELQLSENYYNPIKGIPVWLKALKNFDPSGASGYILDILENDKYCDARILFLLEGLYG
ncbi:hypothetical protein [Leptospira interrogans]|uniref:hypothetical protein n=1 Tax=Leptospira interrogans TaxID=173 RepID=UPI000B1DAEFB|nr:hypothetical protein [Leptospira interrogans]